MFRQITVIIRWHSNGTLLKANPKTSLNEHSAKLRYREMGRKYVNGGL